MTKNRVYGENVIVRIMSSDGVTPYILDFDSIEIQSMTTVRTFKAIGKKVNRHQSYNTGYKITLTRGKRDNHLQALINWNDYHIQKGLEPPLFMIDYIVNHTYQVKDVIYAEELNIDEFTPNNIRKSSKNKSEFSNLRSLTDASLLIAKNAIRRNEAIAKVQDLVVDISKKASYVNNLASSAKNLFNDKSNQRLEDTAEYKRLMALAKTMSGNGFKENFQYMNCEIGEFTSSDAIRTNSMETIVLYSSHRNNLNDDNLFDDGYIVKNMKLEHTRKTEEQSKELIDNLNDVYKLDYQKIIQESLKASFEKMYGNLF